MKQRGTFFPGDMLVDADSATSRLWIFLDIFEFECLNNSFAINCPVCYLSVNISSKAFVSRKINEIVVAKTNRLIRDGKQMTVGDIMVAV